MNAALKAEIGNVVEYVERQEAERLAALRPIVDFRAGDTLCVSLKIREQGNERIQRFEGVCIARSKKGLNASFTLRKISYGHGVERVFPLFSTQIVRIEVKRRGRVRRAKLYYLRELTGRAARIPTASERAEWLAAQPGLPQASLLNMSTALQELHELNGAATGADARAVTSLVCRLLPQTLPLSESRSSSYELILSLGEHLCPLIFSSDEVVARNARASLIHLGKLISGSRWGSDSETHLVTSLQHLQVQVVLWFSLRFTSTGARVSLFARDVFDAAVGQRVQRRPLKIAAELLLEDLREPEMTTLAHLRLNGLRAEAGGEVRCLPNERGKKLITLLAGGREIFRTNLLAEADYIFVI